MFVSDAAILTRASADVRQAFPSQVNFRASWVFITTWDAVAFYGGNMSPSVSTINPCSAELFVYQSWRPKSFFQFDIIIIDLANSSRLI